MSPSQHSREYMSGSCCDAVRDNISPPLRGRNWGSDLRDLLAATGMEIAEARLISAIDTVSAHRATWRFRMTNGCTIKGRRFPTSQLPERLTLVYPCMEFGRFSRVVASKGCAILETWLDGATLAGRWFDDALMAKCGEFLGSIHTTAVPRDWPLARPTLATFHRRLVTRLAEMHQRNLLHSETVKRLIDTVEEEKPRAAEFGFVHRDFCPENLVVSSGRICAIDNASMCEDAFDEDLARTWYRWPMSAANWRSFLEGYRRYRDPRAFLDHFRYWTLFTLVRSALFRADYDPANIRRPLGKLLAILHDEYTNESEVRKLCG